MVTRTEPPWKNYTMILLSAALLVSLGLYAQPEPTHYCDDKQIVAYCNRLSSTGRTCYPLPAVNTGSKLCGAAWQDIPNTPEEIEDAQSQGTASVPVVNVVAYTDNGKWFCDKVGRDANCVKDNTLEMPFQ